MNNNIYSTIKEILMKEQHYYDYQIREIKNSELTVGYPVSLNTELPLTITLQSENGIILSSSIKYESIDSNTVLQLETILEHENISLERLMVKDATTRLDFKEILIIDDQEHFYTKFISDFVNFNYAIVKVFHYSTVCGAEPDVGLVYFSKYDENGIEHWYDIVVFGDIIFSWRKFVIYKDFKQESKDLELCAASIDVESGQLSILDNEEYRELEEILENIKAE